MTKRRCFLVGDDLGMASMYLIIKGLYVLYANSAHASLVWGALASIAALKSYIMAFIATHTRVGAVECR